LITAALIILKVDLALLFGILFFCLNYIPNIGSFFGILAPVPVVLLDPSKTMGDVIAVVLVPFAINNILGCLVEPKLMADGLDLHPLTVVVALTFWGTVC